MLRKPAAELLVVADTTCDCQTECVTDAFDGNAIEYLLEESSHDHANGFTSRESAILCVEYQLIVDSTARRSVRTTYVVGFDFETGNTVGSCIRGEQQVIVSLITVRLLGVFVDLNHSTPNRAGVILQS